MGVAGYYGSGPEYLEANCQFLQPDHVQHECVSSPTCADRIQGNDAWSVDFRFVEISLILDLIGIAERLLPEAAQIDQVVASEAPPLRSQGPHNREDVADLAGSRV